jgi:hypothetical protein
MRCFGKLDSIVVAFEAAVGTPLTYFAVARPLPRHFSFRTNTFNTSMDMHCHRYELKIAVSMDGL